jgi:hypothetical protein
MDLDERRLLLDRTYDRALETVLDGFLHEGFRLTPIDTGDLHERSHEGSAMRYALLDATLPETMLPSCRVAVFELNGSCTLVTAENRLVRYPLLTTLSDRNDDRIGDALQLIVRDEPSTAAR